MEFMVWGRTTDGSPVSTAYSVQITVPVLLPCTHVLRTTEAGQDRTLAADLQEGHAAGLYISATSSRCRRWRRNIRRSRGRYSISSPRAADSPHYQTEKNQEKKIAIASFLSKKHSASPSQAAVRGEINPLADILARLPKKMGEFPTKTCGTFPARPLLHILSQSNHKNIRPIMELTCTPDQASLAAPAP